MIHDNVKRSIDKYFYDNVFTTEGIDIDFEGVPFDNKDKNEWLKVRAIEFEQTYGGNAVNDNYGAIKDVIISANIYVKKSSLANSNRHYALRDTIINYLKIGEDINIYNYTGDDALLYKLRLRELLDDGATLETNELLQYNVLMMGQYTETVMKRAGFLLLEDGAYLLKEDGGRIMLEA